MKSVVTESASDTRSTRSVPPHRRLRVLQVIDSLTVGGAEQLLVTLARHIDRTRYDLQVCSLAPLDDSPIVTDLRAINIPVYSLGGVRLRDPRHMLQLAARVRQSRVDVIHTHLGYGNAIGTLAGWLVGCPVVSTLHNIRDVYPRFGKLKQEVQNQVLRSCSCTIIAVAPEVRAAAVEKLRLPASKVVDVPNGIDTEAFAHPDPAIVAARRRELLADSAGPLVMAVGNLRQPKGHEYLIAATPLVAQTFPTVRVAIVGRKTAYEPVLREQIAACGVEDQVVLTGQRRDVAELVAAADLFVLPSVLEGLPLALLEAMAAGKPVVATAVGGVPRVVDDGETGRLVEPANPAALAAAMVQLLSNPEQSARLAAAGLARVRETYGADAWTQHLQRIYTAVTAGKRGVQQIGAAS